MKITILQGAFLPVPPLLGGAVEKMWFILGKEFARQGHSVVHISRRYKHLPEEEWIEGVQHIRVRGHTTPSSGLWLKWLDFRYTLRAGKVLPPESDIIITNTFWAPTILSTSLRKKCVVDVQRMPKGQIPLYKQAKLFRANSKPVAKAIRRELTAEDHDKVFIIPNPLPFNNLLPVVMENKKPVVLYVGRVHPEKGLALLVKAFKKVGTAWKLQIVGPWEVAAGGGGTAYVNSLRRLAGEENVEFTGPVHDMEQLNRLYAEASIFVYPSVAEQGETFGLAPLEAMAWGCVPVVSKLDCFQDFIKPGENGLAFDHRKENAVHLLRESLLYLMNEEKIRFDLAQKGLDVRVSHSVPYIASLFLRKFGQKTIS
ncbi:glycosyltransferase family 4 protein [Nafulsella turpanensis]|uniref:glycosyltransferase family 4 protein n=1 Tax=Nafulsella turpanensis TaxID=1265690 RepID=UPI00034A83DE|nr:glycosyltransferase family 4 protein [Nafulsella turpanensis]